jgi:hypothetical protein
MDTDDNVFTMAARILDNLSTNSLAFHLIYDALPSQESSSIF